LVELRTNPGTDSHVSQRSHQLINAEVAGPRQKPVVDRLLAKVSGSCHRPVGKLYREDPVRWDRPQGSGIRSASHQVAGIQDEPAVVTPGIVHDPPPGLEVRDTTEGHELKGNAKTMFGRVITEPGEALHGAARVDPVAIAKVDGHDGIGPKVVGRFEEVLSLPHGPEYSGRGLVGRRRQPVTTRVDIRQPDSSIVEDVPHGRRVETFSRQGAAVHQRPDGHGVEPTGGYRIHQIAEWSGRKAPGVQHQLGRDTHA
jgi:hypothetical protein